MKHKFEKNNRYFIMCVYIFVTVLLCIISNAVITNWQGTKAIIGKLMNTISPFLIGLLIAYLINPMVKFFHHKVLKKLLRGKFKKFRRVAAVVISYVIILGAIGAILFYIIPQLVSTLGQVGQFVDSAQNGYASILNKLEAFQDKYPNIDIAPVINVLKETPGKLGQIITEYIPDILSVLYDTSMSLVSGFINLIIAVFISIYMLFDKHRLLNAAKRIVYAVAGGEKGDAIIDEAKKCNEIFGNFIVGKTIDSLIIGIMCFGLMKITDLPYALIISIIVGVTNMIPYFGPFIGAIPGILILLLVDFAYALVFAILIFALQQFDGWYLGPTILGGSTGVRPLWIIFAITVGGAFAGALGMFLGVPIVAVVQYLFDKYLKGKLKSKNIDFDVDEDTGAIHRRVLAIEQKDELVEANKETN